MSPAFISLILYLFIFKKILVDDEFGFEIDNDKNEDFPFFFFQNNFLHRDINKM